MGGHRRDRAASKLTIFLKRFFDIALTAVVLTILSPIMLIIAALIRLDSSGPVLFRQPRLGLGARLFNIYKFRTMIDRAKGNGPKITTHSDSRVTRVGRILRRFDLDELPTLFNVLKGEMSIVGPRPEVPDYLPYYTQDQMRIFSVKPGLTDLGTLAFRQEGALLGGDDPERVYVREILPRKVALGLEYVDRQSFLLDVGIILRTLIAIPTQSKG